MSSHCFHCFLIVVVDQRYVARKMPPARSDEVHAGAQPPPQRPSSRGQAGPRPSRGALGGARQRAQGVGQDSRRRPHTGTVIRSFSLFCH